MGEIRNSLECDGADGILVAYRHDAHKLNGYSHANAPETFAGVPVNQPVPHNADSDASTLSRPDGRPEQTVVNHETPYRLSLIDGENGFDSEAFAPDGIEGAVRKLLTEDDPEAMHRAWLESNVASAFNESVYYPYTSLKYHTLLVAALLDNYRNGHEFVDLRLVVDDAEEIVPHRTVYASERFALRIGTETRERPSASLGSRPQRSWASTWNRLDTHPLDTTSNRYGMVLDANLRRIRAWSTALQYIEEFQAVFDR
jgi:hypothetical protein